METYLQAITILVDDAIEQQKTAPFTASDVLRHLGDEALRYSQAALDSRLQLIKAGKAEHAALEAQAEAHELLARHCMEESQRLVKAMVKTMESHLPFVPEVE